MRPQTPLEKMRSDQLVELDLAIYDCFRLGIDAEEIMEQCQISVDNNRGDFEDFPEDE